MSGQLDLKRCAHCGAWIPAEAEMCASCGTSDVDGVRARQAHVAPGPRGRSRVAFSATSVLIAANFAYLLWSLFVQHAFTPERGAFEALISLSGLDAGLAVSGAYIVDRVAAGEWWRAVTSVFLHGGIFHIGMNMWVLWRIGRIVEELLGAARFLTIYLVSGLGSSLACTVWYSHITHTAHPPMMVGASGAIFGVLGALTVFALRSSRGRGLGIALARNILFMLFIGFLVPFVSNVGHVGGLLPGLAFGAVVGEGFSDRVRPTRARLWTAAALGLSVFSAVALAHGVLFSLTVLGGK